MAVVTSLTAQNTRGVEAVHTPPAAFVAAQIEAIFSDIRVDAVKIGMLANSDIAACVAARLLAHRARNIVLDPVLVSTSGHSLGDPGVIEAMRSHLFPLASLVTPNLPEAGALCRRPTPESPDEIDSAAAMLLEQGATAVLIKGGHRQGSTADDILYTPSGRTTFSSARIATRNTHGTGCSLSSAIACGLAQGLDLANAVGAAKQWLSGALCAADQLDVGHGHGPVHHFWDMWR